MLEYELTMGTRNMFPHGAFEVSKEGLGKANTILAMEKLMVGQELGCIVFNELLVKECISGEL